MISYSKTELSQALSDCGLQAGDVAYFHTRLFSLGMMKDVRGGDNLCRSVLDAIFDVIGEDGSVVVPTFTTQTQRYGAPFILEETECITGMFCEFVRKHEGSVRTLHPLVSVTALGRRKNDICLNVSASGYGYDSPCDRMLKMGAKAVNIGMPFVWNSWMHFLEVVYGVPYLYNKILSVDIRAGGKKLDREMFCPVRYLDMGVVYNYEKTDALLIENDVVEVRPVGSGNVSCVSAKDFCDVVSEGLKRDPYLFLKNRPEYRPGEIPFDGITDGRDQLSTEGFYQHLVTDGGDGDSTP